MSFLRRRWFDFRMGHATYLAFFLSFSNFILIFHRLFIEKVALRIHLWQFGILFILAYVPLAMIIGFWHRKHQLRVDAAAGWVENPLFMKMFHDIEEIKNLLAQTN